MKVVRHSPPRASGEVVERSPTQGASRPRVRATPTVRELGGAETEWLRGEGAPTKPAAASDVPLTREALCQGAPFQPVIAGEVARICGAPVTKEGLERAFASCVPHAKLFLRNATVRGDTFHFDTVYLDRTGTPLAQFSWDLSRHEDGSLEVHGHSGVVEPAQRGNAISLRVLRKDMELLQALSDHPRTRFTMRAGAMSTMTENRSEKIGAYAWAQAGFAFADEHDAVSSTIGYGARTDDPDLDKGQKTLTLMRSQFARWLNAQREGGALDCDDDTAAQILEATQLWKRPKDIANFDLGPELRVTLERNGKQFPASLGKAFLLSDDSPSWDGVLFTSKKTIAGASFGAYTDRSIARADQAAKARDEGWRKALRGDDPGKLLDAIEEIGLEGDPSWRTALDEAYARHPGAREEIELAKERLDGLRVRPGLVEQAEDEQAAPPVRARAAGLLAELEGRIAPLEALLGSDDARVRAYALDEVGRLTSDERIVELATPFLDAAPPPRDEALEKALKVLAEARGEEYKPHRPLPAADKAAAVFVLSNAGEPGRQALQAHLSGTSEEDKVELMDLVHRANPGLAISLALDQERLRPPPAAGDPT